MSLTLTGPTGSVGGRDGLGATGDSAVPSGRLCGLETAPRPPRSRLRPPEAVTDPLLTLAEGRLGGRRRGLRPDLLRLRRPFPHPAPRGPGPWTLRGERR